MTPEQYARLTELFQGALDQAPASRGAWLDEACSGDHGLRREVEALLRAHETSAGFLEEPAQLDAPDRDALTPGSALGPYTIVEEIARGGMGIVYLAEDSRLGRRVALKALPTVVSVNAEFRERLRREARAAATITHPGVATVYSLDEIDGHLVIASEYVAGETLRALLARGPLDAERTRAVAAQIVGALGAAHESGVVHRDLKPDNVLVTPGGHVKVVDFGIAHMEGPEAMRLTRTGALLGTPAYMAPEQLLGRPVDARADIYAFGVLLSELLTGRHPLAETPPQGTTLPASPAAYRLAAIAAKCMQRDPASRYGSARDLLAALESDAPVPSAAIRSDATAGSARWWWEFHQAVTALVYWLMAIPAWWARQAIGGAAGRVFFIVTLVSIVVAANLRLHLWFTARSYPGQLRWARRRSKPWIRGADWVFVVALAAGGLVIDSSPLSILLLSFGIGAAIAFLMIEPATTRAAFRSSVTPSAGVGH